MEVAGRAVSYEREVTPGTYNGVLIRTVTQTNTVDSTTGVNYDTTTTITEPVTGVRSLKEFEAS